MILHRQFSSTWSSYVIIYIILSTWFCPLADGSNENTSSTSDLDGIFTRYLLANVSNFIHTPIPKCEEPTTPKNIALASFSALVMLLGLGGNLMVILVIQYSQLRKEPGYVLVKSLALADFSVCLFVTTAKIRMYQQNGNFCSDMSFCVFYHATDGFFPTASITHLLIICINKFCAVNSPYKYHTLVTYQREIIVVICAWFYCLLWTTAGLVTWETNPLLSLNVISDGIDKICFNTNQMFYVFAAICVFVVPVLVAGFLYAILFVIVVEKTQATPSLVCKDDAMEGNESHQKSPTRPSFGSKKGAKTLLMVFATWVICWMPHFSLVLVNYWSPLSIHSFVEHNEWLAELISDILPCINSCINPFIYFKTSSVFRHSLRDSYLKMMKRPRFRVGSNRLKHEGSWKSPSLDTVVKYGVAGETVSSMSQHPNV